MLAHDHAVYPCGRGHIYCRNCYGPVCPECEKEKNAKLVKLHTKVSNRGNGAGRRLPAVPSN